MGDINIDVSKLPDDVREKLAELELELSEGKQTDVEMNSYNESIKPFTRYLNLSTLLFDEINRFR